MIDITTKQPNNSKSDSVVIVFSKEPFVEQLEHIRNLFDAAVDKGCSEVVVDFEDVDYLCSTSLAELVRMKKIAIEKEITLTMVHLSAYIMEIFRTTRLLKFFEDQI